MDTKTVFENQALDFLEKLFQTLTSEKIQIEDHWDVDHLCYRVDSIERYRQLKEQFLSFSKLLIESPVNGRPISTFRLNKPIEFQSHKIFLVELPAPKMGKIVKEGFEHIEVVCDVPFYELEKKYARLTLDKGGLKKDFNQELEICLGDRNVKFHQISLESVIRLEENKKIHEVILESEILKTLKPFSPLVAGTFPLGLQTEKSDVDILLQASDLGYIQEIIEAYFSPYPDLKIKRSTVDGKPSLIANFSIQNVSFELFAQNVPTVQQTAYRHFLAEERILKLGGDQLKEQVMKLRMQGEKTEPAFAKCLGLTGDPYQAILNLHDLPLSKFFTNL